MQLVPKDVAIDDIILDPNNYRFRDDPNFQLVPKDKLHLDVNQNRATAKLKGEIIELTKSIKSNGFLPVERVVVYQYETDPSKYVVIEGNRRVASLKQIASEIQQGIFVSEELSETIEAVPCLLAEGAEEATVAAFRESLMGIRHVSGIKQWGGYQRAQLIYELRTTHGLDATTVAERVGLSVQEVNRRFRAISALNNMLKDDEYGEKASPAMYPLFHEAAALPAVRDWLKWDNDTNEFKDNTTREQFYNLMVGTEDDEGQRIEPKLQTYQDVRQLRDILADPQAKSYLLDPDEKFATAVSAAARDQIQRKWRDEVAQALSALKSITVSELVSIGDSDLAALNTLINETKRILDTHAKLK